MTEITETPPEDMNSDELLAEWQEAYERLLGPIEDDDEHERLHSRRSELWQEMKSRTGTEPPECPRDGCEGGQWAQEFGGPKVCGECDLHLGGQHEDLISEIDAYWRAVKDPASA